MLQVMIKLGIKTDTHEEEEMQNNSARGQAGIRLAGLCLSLTRP